MKITFDHFLGADDEMVDYLISQGLAAVEKQEQAYNFLRDKALKFIGLLLTGSGGSFLLFYNVEKNSGFCYSSAGLLLCAIGWFACVLMIASECVSVRKRFIAYSSPAKLYIADGDKMISVDKLKRLQLYEYSLVVTTLQRTTKAMGECFNHGILIAAGTPVLSLVLALPFFFT